MYDLKHLLVKIPSDAHLQKHLQQSDKTGNRYLPPGKTLTVSLKPLQSQEYPWASLYYTLRPQQSPVPLLTPLSLPGPPESPQCPLQSPPSLHSQDPGA